MNGLFRAAAQTLVEAAANPRHLGAEIGCRRGYLPVRLLSRAFRGQLAQGLKRAFAHRALVFNCAFVRVAPAQD